MPLKTQFEQQCFSRELSLGRRKLESEYFNNL